MSNQGNPDRLNWLRRLTRQRLVHLSFATWVMLLAQTAFLVLYFRNLPEAKALGTGEKVAFALTNYAVTIVYFQLIGLLLRRRRWALRIANLVSVVLLAFLLGYHYHAGEALDYQMLGNNIQLLAYEESFRVLVQRSSVASFVALGTFAAVMGVVAFGTRLMARWPRPPHYRTTLLLSAVALIAILATPIYSYNELTFLSRTAYDYFVSRHDCPPGYPYVRRAAPGDGDPAPGPRPHIFIMMIESFNANFVGRRTESGAEYTPFFNSLRTEGLYVKRFYGNSIQTCRGQLATLCSVLPSYRRKTSERRPPINLRSLPAILADRGYSTYFFQAYKTLEFDNTGAFMKHLGFGTVKCMDAEFIRPEDEPYVWGWGLQDDRFYRKVFEYLDRHHAADAGPGNAKPCLVTLAPISNHMAFCDMPEDQRHLYPHAADPKQWFANSVHLADRYLREFFRQLAQRSWLADSIVIVTADHGYPAGEHGNFHNEKHCYEESFLIPFVLIWKGRVLPRVIDKVAYSQIDITPTLLELLGIREDHHFLGRSMLAEAAEQHPIHLIQPYGGVHLAAVLYPMKYVVIKRTGREFLYDLSRDPHEDTNLIEAYEDNKILGRLRDEVRAIHINQQLLERNRIWPGQ